MNIRVLGSYGSRLPGQHSSSLLLNDNLLIDAGTVTAALGLEQQLAIDDVLLTHAHLDHMVDLAFLIDNVLTLRQTPLRIWAPPPVLDALHRHLFNDEVWPDFTRLPTAQAPALRLVPLDAGKENEVAGLRVRWARTNHPVWTAGYYLTDGSAGLLHSGDTGVTGAVWSLARDCPQLKIAFVETSFPNRLAALAEASGHLTPALLRQELAKLGRDAVPVKIFHIKPQFLAEIVAELNALGDGRLQVLHGGEQFSL